MTRPLKPQTAATLKEFLSSTKPLQIIVYSKKSWWGMGPCIFIGPAYYRIRLAPEYITIKIMQDLFARVISDDNKKAIVDLLRYAAYNKRRFWDRHKRSPLGIQIMAEILGQNE